MISYRYGHAKNRALPYAIRVQNNPCNGKHYFLSYTKIHLLNRVKLMFFCDERIVDFSTLSQAMIHPYNTCFSLRKTHMSSKKIKTAAPDFTPKRLFSHHFSILFISYYKKVTYLKVFIVYYKNFSYFFMPWKQVAD